jgi:hypothetical protein
MDSSKSIPADPIPEVPGKPTTQAETWQQKLSEVPAQFGADSDEAGCVWEQMCCSTSGNIVSLSNEYFAEDPGKLMTQAETWQQKLRDVRLQYGADSIEFVMQKLLFKWFCDDSRNDSRDLCPHFAAALDAIMTEIVEAPQVEPERHEAVLRRLRAALEADGLTEADVDGEVRQFID